MRKLIIHNARLGFANNSSSSHSLVFLRGASAVSEDRKDGDFGWADFTLTSKEAKSEYLGAMLAEAFERELRQPNAGGSDPTPELARKLAGSITGVDPRALAGLSVDHQSRLTLPLMWDGEHVHRGFVKELHEFLLRDDVAVLGGNDNDGTHPLDGSLPEADRGLCDLREGPLMIARKGASPGLWTLFNRHTGAKLRMSFGDSGVVEHVAEKADAPELVDVKITDHCPFGCVYCYQGSTVTGRHADYKEIRVLAEALGSMQCFEVAIGGGEPTLHPRFLDILREFRGRNIVPNFTTFRSDWIRPRASTHESLWTEEVLKTCGSFALSVTEPSAVFTLRERLAAAGWGSGNSNGGYGSRAKASAQVVIGTVPEAKLAEIFMAAAATAIPLTLLGFKTVGRGAHYQRHEIADWSETLIKSFDACESVERLAGGRRHIEVCIDTALAAESVPKLVARGIPKWMYHTTEGAFSMYVDAVHRRAGPSSFCAENEYVELRGSDWRGNVERAFAGF